MAGTLTTRDPVDIVVRDLARRLRGPGRLRRGMLAEVRAGLEDATEAHLAGGATPAEARRRAVAEFGEPAELAPLFQAELGATQGLRTALLLALAFPGLLLGWDLVWALGGDGAPPPAPAVRLLARVEDGASLTVGLLAAFLAGLLTLRARAGRDTRRPARAAAWVGALGAGLCAGLAVAMHLVGDDPASAALGSPHAALAAYVVSTVVFVAVVRSVAGTLRATRSAPPG